MTQYKYAGRVEGDFARAVLREAPISSKQAIEICREIRGKPLEKAKIFLQSIIDMKKALPMRRYNRGGTGHKPGKTGPGRYPIKTSTHALALLNSVEANAKDKGLDTKNLIIKHACAHRGSGRQRYTNRGAKQMKRTNMEIIVQPKVKIEQKKQTEKPKETKND